MVQLSHKTDRERHAEALRTSSRLTRTYYRMYRPGEIKVTPEEVIPVLNRAGVKFVLMGTHGVGGWRSEPRATDDVDFLIQKRYHRKAVRAIQEAFPTLETTDQQVVTRFVDPTTKRVVIDLMRPHESFYQAVFKNCVRAGFTHDIPDLEMALVSKFAAMVSPHRLAKKKAIDTGDFMDIVDENHEIIDLPKLRRLAEKVYSGGGDKIVHFVEESRAGRIPKL